MPAGAPLNDDPRHPEYPLPFSKFGGHRENTHAHCARIALDDHSTLLVPCMELVRFYFGASGSFLKRLFSGAFALDRLYSKARLNHQTRTANVDLAEDLSGAAAATVARIAFDCQARRAASWIVNSAVAAAANGSRYYPKTSFPFLGETDLTADGRWIEHGSRRIFLAEQLVRCTHPFPFDSLYYTTCKSPLNKPTLIRPAMADHGVEQDATDFTDVNLSEQAVSNHLQPVGIAMDDDIEAFPDLARKKVRRVKESSRIPMSTAQGAPLDDLASGVETARSDTRAAEVADNLDEHAVEELPPEAVETFEKAFGAFRAASSNPVSLIPPVGRRTAAAVSSEPFVRADAICQLPDARVVNVWCSMFKIDNAAMRLLVLVRAHLSGDADDNVVLLKFNEPPTTNDVEDCIAAFATRGTQWTQPTRNPKVVGRLNTKGASEFYAVLRAFSLGVQRMMAPPSRTDRRTPEVSGSHG
jgi:hypothetical protein